MSSPSANSDPVLRSANRWFAATVLTGALTPWLAGLLTWGYLAIRKQPVLSGAVVVALLPTLIALSGYLALVSLVPGIIVKTALVRRGGERSRVRFSDRMRRRFVAGMLAGFGVSTLVFYCVMWRNSEGALMVLALWGWLVVIAACLTGIVTGILLVAGTYVARRISR